MSKKQIPQPWDYFPLLRLFVFTSRKKLNKFVKKRTGISPDVLGTAGQCTWYENKGDGGFVAILLECEDHTPIEKTGLLAHECMHYVQYVAEAFKTRLDSETEAYILQSAMHACIEQLGEKWLTKTPQAKKLSKKQKTN